MLMVVINTHDIIYLSVHRTVFLTALHDFPRYKSAFITAVLLAKLVTYNSVVCPLQGTIQLTATAFPPH